MSNYEWKPHSNSVSVSRDNDLPFTEQMQIKGKPANKFLSQQRLGKMATIASKLDRERNVYANR